ncbi:NineTeen Complex (NTC) component [Boothiomyces sp. JEL0838]|nr:NineTeen Complex (NTC) component [Boothiomyces sp. JEL0838]
MAPKTLAQKQEANILKKYDGVDRTRNKIITELEPPKPKRPFTSAGINTVKECEKWRKDIVDEILEKIEEISDPNLDEYKVRDTNDAINKLIKEKRHWEHKIIELGGPDYIKRGTVAIEAGGSTVPGTKGYRYFGMAKYLPGVKELFEQAAQMQQKIAPEELVQRVDADYYGFRDEEDGLLLQYESMLQANKKKEIVKDDDGTFDLDYITPKRPPTFEEIEGWMVKKRQKELEAKYLNGLEA